MRFDKVILFTLIGDLASNISAVWFGLVVISPFIDKSFTQYFLTVGLFSGIVYFAIAYIVRMYLKNYEYKP